MLIELSMLEQEIACLVANARRQLNRKNNTRETVRGKMSGEEMDLEGFAAELALAKYLNVYPDLTSKLTGKDTDIGDLIIHTDLGVKHIDVKTTKYKTGNLIIPLSKTGQYVDYFALMIGQFPAYTFMGLIRTEQAMVPENIKPVGNGEAYFIPAGKLRLALY